MSLALQHRVSSLEAEVKALRETIDGLIAAITAEPEQKHNPNGPRQMCPKCGEQPAYHFHVKHCQGKRPA